MEPVGLDKHDVSWLGMEPVGLDKHDVSWLDKYMSLWGLKGSMHEAQWLDSSHFISTAQWAWLGFGESEAWALQVCIFWAIRQGTHSS